MPDPGWVRIYHPDFVAALPDPDDPDGADDDKFATVTESSYEAAWKRRGWRLLDQDREAAQDLAPAAETADTSNEEQTTAAGKRGDKRSAKTEES